MSEREQLRRHLLALESELRRLKLWQPSPPSADALASSEPFCVDTLSLSEWLQWLLIPRINALLDGQLPLPAGCNITALAEESFKNEEQDCSRLIQLIGAIDASITRAD
ncbi:YqcC family protein [Motiliproteus sediminis]|uniref:YqcC family protein n=1 Tax=Motiliproteus sediminis TaxID=1468178 RepID=UPI001AEF67CD|nr:YqcC family protein [Motiliproteus sediminis]